MKLKIPFMKIVVIFCLSYAVYLTENAIGICDKNGGVGIEAVYASAILFFGSELVGLLVKKILEKRSKSKRDEEGEL